MNIQQNILVQEAESKLREVLKKVPFIEVGISRLEPTQGQEILFRPDILMQINTPDGPETLVAEVKSTMTPKLAREASREAASLAAILPAAYGLVVAPYISERSAEICREAGVGFLDLAGNYGLYFNRVYLEVQGRPNVYKKGQALKSLFSPKSSRAIRAMLENPERIWQVKSLAKETGLSAGMISNIKARLEEQELIRIEPVSFMISKPEASSDQWSNIQSWIKDLDSVREENDSYRIVLSKQDKNDQWWDFKPWLEQYNSIIREPGGFRLTDPEALLMEWGEKYSIRNNRWSNFYMPATVDEIESGIAGSLKSSGQQYAFTLFSAAKRVAPFSRYQRVFLYLDGDETPLVEDLGLKPVESGPNVTILEPYDSGVFYAKKEIDNRPMVGMIQLYLDLVSYKGRGEEAARFLLDNELRKKWQENI